VPIPKEYRFPVSVVISGTSENALILYWPHPSDTVRSLAVALAYGLSAHGMSVTCLDLCNRRHLSKIHAADRKAFSRIFALGSIPFRFLIGESPLYDYFEARFYFWVLDPIIYDLETVHATQTFVERCGKSDRLFFLFPDRTYLDIVQDTVGNNRCVYFPYAASFSDPTQMQPETAASPGPQAPIILLASVGSELSEFASLSAADVVRQLDPFGLDAHRRCSLVEHVQNDETYSNVTSSVRTFMALEAREILKEPVFRFLNALDSTEKRRRRIMAVASVRAFKMDIFGSGWEQYLSDCPNFRYFGGIRHDFLADSFRGYKVLFDFAPNWDHGYNDRVVTALGAGCRVVTTRNSAASELGAAAELVSHYSANHPAPSADLETALASPPVGAELLSVIRNDHNWKVRVNSLLRHASQAITPWSARVLPDATAGAAGAASTSA